MLARLRAADLAIAAINRERNAEHDRHHREVERLTGEIAEHEQQRQEAARQLVAIFETQGRPDLAGIYATLQPAEEQLATWKAMRNG